MIHLISCVHIERLTEATISRDDKCTLEPHIECIKRKIFAVLIKTITILLLFYIFIYLFYFIFIFAKGLAV